MNRNIPDGWNLIHLGDYVSVLTGFPFSSVKYSENSSEINLIRGANIGQGHFKWNDTVYWPTELVSDYKDYFLEIGDIVLAMDRPWIPAGIKYAWITEKEIPCLLVQRVARIRGSVNLLTEYIRHLFASNSFSIHIQKSITGTNVPHISKADIENYKFLLPPISEQTKIASILSIWDEAIALTEKLIAGLQQRKKGLMQRLLIGEVRFPKIIQSNNIQETKYGDLPADWKYVSISEIADQVTNKNKNGDDLPVLSCTKYDGLVDSLEYFGRQIFSDDLSSYKIVDRGQFAYATNHIEEGSIGYQDLHEQAVISPMYTVFQTNNRVNDSFLYKLMKTELYRHIFEINTSASVNRRGSLRWNAFSQIKIPLPSLEEQATIADVIDTSDNQIAVAKKYLDALQTQKKGIMQRLLTGQIRVDVD